MNFDQEITLNRDTLATIIPAGEEYTIPAGTVVTISQALGGAVTVRTAEGLYRIPSKDWDALGAELKEYLNETATQPTQAKSDQPFSKDLVWDALKQCFDPEIPLNIVDLGLIYDLRISEPSASCAYQVYVQMTLTAQGCGMGPVIAEDAKKQIELIPEVESAEVHFYFQLSHI